MSELQLQVSYKPLPNRIAFASMCGFFPIWAIIAPATLGVFVSRAIFHPELAAFTATFLGCLASAGITIGGIALTAIAEDNNIHVSKDGVSFPLFLVPKLKFRRARSWSELLAADVVRQSDPEKKGANYLLLTFDTGCLWLKLNYIKPADIEQLLLAIELWAVRCKRSEALIEYQRNMQNRELGVGQAGYTQMWEEELGRRFQSTAFIPLEPGKSLRDGRLKIIRQLAFGGLSAIYLAQENSRNLVVLKEAVIPPSADAETRAQAEKRLIREADVLSKLQHENIARVFDHFVEDGRHYLMLEYINGQDLRQYVKQNGKIDQLTAIQWGLKILDILRTLHKQSPPILHRDLTPENLVVTKESIKLIDFGAANQFIGAATGTVVGKQAYIPPEQLRGKSVIESDLYAFAGTMYFLLTGKDPLPLSTAHPRSEVPEVDQALDEMIATCSAFEPEDRFHSADEMRVQFESILDRLMESITPGKALVS